MFLQSCVLRQGFNTALCGLELMMLQSVQNHSCAPTILCYFKVLKVGHAWGAAVLVKESGIEEYVSYFPHCCDKTSKQKQFKEGRICFSS